MVRAGVKLLAGLVCCGMAALNQSHRTPRLIVNRSSFHWSCANNPPSRWMSWMFFEGPFDTDTRYGAVFSVNWIATSLLYGLDWMAFAHRSSNPVLMLCDPVTYDTEASLPASAPGCCRRSTRRLR